ncbi:pentatricopeptide repeat-containing protein At2g45350, chloroplastic [Lactuca sativa]|uniref:pentatricopeptide repeat-containing protein At2g45350, chloroplastic n=1 Tax=Lactuca sativa TaxID=4236 RepID=UPI000CD8B788|nr:pentatricopeptide repeat-containing protein At2g45350, chloroplastic [Lactuca sativa]
MLTCVNSNQQPWNSTLPTLIHLPNCKTQFDINQIHARLLTTGFIKNSYLTTKLILNFASSPHTPLIQFARHIFFSHSIPRSSKMKDPFVWNAIIKTFSHGDDPKQAVFVLGLMLQNRACVDKFSFSLVLKACSQMGLIREGMQVHGFLIKIGLTSDLYLQNCLISMYVRGGCVEFARQVFDRMPERDSISFNSMIDGYVKCGMITSARELFDSLPSQMKNLRSWNCMISGYAVVEDGFSLAWELFDEMPERDMVSWNLMIRCCIKSGKIDLARTLFDRMPEKDVISWAKLIDGYAKLGNINTARHLFDEMPQRDIISCNVIMAGYLQNGGSLEALNIFHNIMSDNNLTPDDTTFSLALSAIAQLGYAHEGITIHTYINNKGLKLEGKLGVALIDMYSKSGMIETAMHVFETLKQKNIDHYNAMIGGLGIHGFGKQAFNMFLEIQTLNLKPDAITYLNVLNACAHSGLLKEGVMCFKIMTNKMEPEIQHFGCLIDIFARAGKIKEAMGIIDQMPFEPNGVMWRTLFSACKNLENTIDTKIPILKDEIMMDCYDSSNYILLSNIYARFGMWDFVRKVRGMMKVRKIKKVPGRSWIELDGTFHEFFVGDGCHPQVEEIYSVLDNWSHVKSFGLESKFESDLFLIGS